MTDKKEVTPTRIQTLLSNTTNIGGGQLSEILDQETFIKSLRLKDDYELCANFNKGRYQCC